MAKIVTGNTDLLREYYELRAGTYDVFQAVFQLLEGHWGRDSMERVVAGTSTSNEVVYGSGTIFALEGENLNNSSPESWNISRLTARINDNGERIILSGNMSLSTEYKLAVGSSANEVTIFDPIGGPQILDEDAMPSSAQLLGRLQVETNGYPYVDILYTEKSASWNTGLKLRLIGQTQDSNQAGSPEKSQKIDTVVIERDGEQIFRIDDFEFIFSNLTESILAAGVDAFIEYFLSGDDEITGTSGIDTLYSGAGNDTVDAGAGNDLLIGGSGLGNDSYIGGDGIDTIKYTSAAAGIRVDLGKGKASSVSGDSAAIGVDQLSGIENIVGGKFNDTLIGDGNANQIDAGAGNDILSGGEGDDSLDGGEGLDFAVFDTPASAINKSSNGWSVNGDTLINVERLAFSDKTVALDIAGHAGSTAKLLGATFGKESLANKALVGIALSYMDAGTSYSALMELAINAVLGSGASNAAAVDLLYTNVVGVAPSVNDLAFFTDWLDKGIYTKASFGVLAADTELNIVNVGLVGLASTGLEYTPYVA